MSTVINVPLLSSRTISTSGDYAVTLGIGSTILVERNSASPLNDPVNASFDTLSVIGLTNVKVQHASLAIEGLANVNLLTNFSIGDGGKLDLSDTVGLNVASPITFAGAGGVLVLDRDVNLSLLSGISGFNDDVISFRDVPVATSASYANGVLSVYNGASQVASVALSGTFDASQLGVQSNGKGGINVGVGLGNGGGLPNDAYATGLHSEYVVARTGLGQLYLEDEVRGRDAVATVTDAKYFLFADGVGRFDATGVAQEVAHVYQAAFDRRPDAGGLEFWTSKVEAGTLSERDVATGFMASAEFRANYDGLDDTAFVSKLYANVLDRAGEQSGITYWTNQLSGGAGRNDVLFSFANSFENVHNTIKVTGDTEYGVAYRLYEAALDRVPELSGLNYWYNLLESGVSNSAVAQGFINSPEFQGKYGGLDNAGFVAQLYENVLDRPGDVAGLQYWQNQLASGASRADVLFSFADSLENRIQTAEATHDNWIYLGIA